LTLIFFLVGESCRSPWIYYLKYPVLGQYIFTQYKDKNENTFIAKRPE